MQTINKKAKSKQELTVPSALHLICVWFMLFPFYFRNQKRKKGGGGGWGPCVEEEKLRKNVKKESLDKEILAKACSRNYASRPSSISVRGERRKKQLRGSKREIEERVKSGNVIIKLRETSEDVEE